MRRESGAVVCPSSLPPAPNYGATFNKTAFLVLGQIIGRETRALWLAGALEESNWSQHGHIGLDVWSPNINMVCATRPRAADLIRTISFPFRL